MKIRCLILRPKGSQVTIGKVAYDFQPDKQGRHVAEVTNDDHIAIFLAIKEGYCKLGDEPVEDDAPADDAPAEQFPLADMNVDTLTNSELISIGQRFFKLNGSNKESALAFARDQLGVDLSVKFEQSTYIDLLREITSRAIAFDREDKLKWLNEQAANRV